MTYKDERYRIGSSKVKVRSEVHGAIEKCWTTSVRKHINTALTKDPPS